MAGFAIEERIAEGGFAVVYKAWQIALDRQVALKILKARAGTTTWRMPSSARSSRLRRERSRACGTRTSSTSTTSRWPRCRPASWSPWMALEWLEGETLAMHLGRRRAEGRRGRAPGEALDFVRPVLVALAHAHKHAIVHRDIKPANIMVTETAHGPALRVLDFGIAKIIADDAAPSTGHTRTESAPAFSPAYAAPEQVTFSRTGPWTDVHALGLDPDRVMTDEAPFSDGHPDLHLFEQVMAAARPTPASKGRDVGPFEAVIARALALSPRGQVGTERGRAAGGAGRRGGRQAMPSPAGTPAVPEANRRRLGPLAAGLVVLVAWPGSQSQSAAGPAARRRRRSFVRRAPAVRVDAAIAAARPAVETTAVAAPAPPPAQAPVSVRLKAKVKAKTVAPASPPPRDEKVPRRPEICSMTSMTWRDVFQPAAAAIACALCVGQSPLVRAADVDEAGARVLFVEGRKLAAAGNYAEACPKFEDSFRLDPGIGTNFNLADCLEHTGRIASAWARFLDVAAATKLAGQLERERVARDRAATLEPRLARLIVRVPSPAPGLVVERDKVMVTPSSWGVAVPIDPGLHAISVTASGMKPWSTDVKVPDGEPATISVSVPALEALPPPPPPVVAALAPPQPQPGPPRRHLSPPSVLLGSLGILGLVTGAVFGAEFQQANSEAKALCRPVECTDTVEQSRHQSLIDEASRDRTLAFVSAAIGGVALASAILVWWRSAETDSTRKASATVTARPRLWAPALGADLTIQW